MSNAMVDELNANLRKIAHLSSDEQLRMFDENLSYFESHVTKMEADSMPKNETLEMLAQSTRHYPLAQAKAMFIANVTPWLERIKPFIEYLSILQGRFPSSSRVSSLKRRYVIQEEHLNSLIRAIEQY